MMKYFFLPPGAETTLTPGVEVDCVSAYRMFRKAMLPKERDALRRVIPLDRVIAAMRIDDDKGARAVPVVIRQGGGQCGERGGGESECRGGGGRWMRVSCVADFGATTMNGWREFG